MSEPSAAASALRAVEGIADRREITPFQPTGPYPQVMLDLPTGAAIPLSPEARGQRIVIEGSVTDGAGQPVADVMIETWQADAAGRYAHASDPDFANADAAFWGYRRVATDADGRFTIETVKPGATRAAIESGAPGVEALHAPHLVVAIYGGGILYRYVTRMYFAGDEANAVDPILRMVPPDRRSTLIMPLDGGVYRCVIRLQGPGETVFFDL